MLSVCFSCALATGTTFISLVPLGSLYNAIPYTSFHFSFKVCTAVFSHKPFVDAGRIYSKSLFFLSSLLLSILSRSAALLIFFCSFLFFILYVSYITDMQSGTNLSLSNVCCINGLPMMGTLAHLKSLIYGLLSIGFMTLLVSDVPSSCAGQDVHCVLIDAHHDDYSGQLCAHKTLVSC